MFSTRESTSGLGLAPTNELHCGHVDWTSLMLSVLTFLQNVPMAFDICFPEVGVIRSPLPVLLLKPSCHDWSGLRSKMYVNSELNQTEVGDE